MRYCVCLTLLFNCHPTDNKGIFLEPTNLSIAKLTENLPVSRWQLVHTKYVPTSTIPICYPGTKNIDNYVPVRLVDSIASSLDGIDERKPPMFVIEFDSPALPHNKD